MEGDAAGYNASLLCPLPHPRLSQCGATDLHRHVVLCGHAGGSSCPCGPDAGQEGMQMLVLFDGCLFVLPMQEVVCSGIAIHHTCTCMQVQRQLPSLPEDGLPALLNRLVECIQLATQRFPAAVSPLAVAMAALVVQWQDSDGALHALGALSCRQH